MNADVHSQDFAIAIIGGGAGGVLTALHALRLATAGTRIVMIEPATRLADGWPTPPGMPNTCSTCPHDA